jgi:hypothetical protein
VDHTSGVGVVQRAGHLPQFVHNGFGVRPRLVLEPPRQAFSSDELHRHVSSVTLFQNVVDAHDVGVRERCCGARIAQQTIAQKFAFARIIHAEHNGLHGHLAVQQDIFGKVDDAHGTESQLAANRVSAYLLLHDR